MTVWLQASAGTSKASGPQLGRCSWGSSTIRARCNTWCAITLAQKRLELAEFLAPYRENALANHPWKGWAEGSEDGHRMPGGQSCWSHGKDLSWEALRPELVVEVAYEHMQGPRFRHMSQFRRWRFDKKPADCTYAQLEVIPPQELETIFAAGR